MKKNSSLDKAFWCLSAVFMLIWKFGGDKHIPLFSLWAICAFVFTIYYARDYSKTGISFLVMFLILCLKVIISPQGIMTQPEAVGRIAVGQFIQKEDGCFLYQTRKPDNKTEIWKIKVPPSRYNNETAEFMSIREFAVLEEKDQEYSIKSFDADRELYNSSIVCLSKNCYTESLSIANSYLHAQQYPTDYYEKYGLMVVYWARIVDVSGQNMTLEYSDALSRVRRVDIRGAKIGEKGDLALISHNVNSRISNNWSVVGFADGVDDKSIGLYGFKFADTLVSKEYLFEEIPQLKKHFANYISRDQRNYGKIGLAYYLDLKYVPNGRLSDAPRPMYFFRDKEGDIVSIMDYVYMESDLVDRLEKKPQRERRAVLVDYETGKVVNRELQPADYQRYKYPVSVNRFGEEIGNKSFAYAQIERYKYLRYQGPSVCFCAKVDSLKSRNIFYDAIVRFRDLDGKQKSINFSIPEPISSDTIVVVKTNDGYEAADPKFNSKEYFDKIKGGYAFYFTDTILTGQEFLKAIPEAKEFVDIILK